MMKNSIHKKTSSSGFTLIEMIVTVGIVAMLSTIGLTGYGKVMEKTRQARELNAARTLMIAYQIYAQDNGGALLPGYQDEADIENFEGGALHSPISSRYPWRLAPYIDTVDQTLVYNGNEEVLTAKNSDYLVSVRPNLGINANFVGGHYGNSSLLRPGQRLEDHLGRWYVSHLGQAHNPSELIVFASARSTSSEGDASPGYFEVRPPQVVNNVWIDEPFDKDFDAASHGFIDFRWDGRAVAAMMDGSARLLDEEQMRDMRRWSNDASREDDPNYTIKY